MIGEGLSNKIRNAGLVCACLVVPIHLSHPKSGGGAVLDRCLSGALSNVAVPIFFAISGYLLAEKSAGKAWWSREILKRVRSLVVPFFCWTFFAVVLSGLPSLVLDWRASALPFSTYFKSFEGFSDVGKLLGIDLTGMPWFYPLWYVRNLFILVACSGCLVIVIRKWGFGWIIFTALLYFGWRYYSPWLPDSANGIFWHGFSLQGLLCFSFGIWLHGQNLNVCSCKSGFALLCVGILANMFACKFSLGIANVFYAFSWACLGGALWLFVPSGKWPNALTAAAFPIYLIHVIVIGWIGSFPNVAPSTSSLHGFLLFWLMPIASSVLVSIALRRCAPTFSRIVFGGR